MNTRESENGMFDRYKELKPCPFCGEQPFVWQTNHYTYIQCKAFTAIDEKGHQIQVSRRTEDAAIQAWNERVAESEDKE